MNPLDMVIVAVLCFCLVRGFFRGLVKELSSIIGVFAGFYAAYTYYRVLAGYMTKWTSGFEHTNIICFLIIFLSVFVTISILGLFLKYILNISFLGWIDRICGTCFGFIKGILVVSILLLVLTTFLKQNRAFIKRSVLSPYVMVISETMAQLVSTDIKKTFSTKIKELKKAWNIN
ncbi:MAG TPA: colicin V production protein [Desulfobacteraceae bacterium]|nr:colicin V production protein [Desulfobacteraceae bacterium]